MTGKTGAHRRGTRARDSCTRVVDGEDLDAEVAAFARPSCDRVRPIALRLYKARYLRRSLDLDRGLPSSTTQVFAQVNCIQTADHQERSACLFRREAQTALFNGS